MAGRAARHDSALAIAGRRPACGRSQVRCRSPLAGPDPQRGRGSGRRCAGARRGAAGLAASMRSTIAVVPHEQNGVSVREHDCGADGCPAPLRQPVAEPVGSQVHRNRGRRPARASRRRPSDRRPRACAALAASLAPTRPPGWPPRAEPILLGHQDTLRFHDHLEPMCAANDPAVGCAASQCGRPM